MIRRIVWIQLGAFLVISVVVALYLGVGILRLPILSQPFSVSMVTAETGGLFPHAIVTYRGVEVGRVDSVQVIEGGGVRTVMSIDSDAEIPSDLTADISAFSAVGEQYVNLEPSRSGEPYLQDGDVIATADTELPPRPSDVLADASRFLSTLDVDALTTVIEELGLTFDGLGPTLQQVLDDGQRITATLQETLPETIGVIQDGAVVLDGRLAQQGSIRSFSDDLNALSEQLVDSDADLRTLLDTGTAVSRELALLLDDPTRASLAVLLGNLVTTNEILAVRSPAIEQLAIVLPDSLTALTGLIQGNELPIDLFFGDTPRCDYGTPAVPPNETDGADPPPPFIDKECPPSDTDHQRGARQAPSPGGDTAGPGGSDRQAAPREARRTARYDPFTGAATGPAGESFTIGSSAAYAPALGDASWLTLLLSGLRS